MNHNELLFFRQDLSGSADDETLKQHISLVMDEMSKIYSYSVTADRSSPELVYTIRYAVSKTDRYNTLTKDVVVNGIIKTIQDDKSVNGRYIIGHKQPPLDLLIELYEPLIQKHAKIHHQRWKHLEYEDICQIGRMVFVVLYNKGYLIHSDLFRTAFNNEILQEVKRTYKYIDCASLSNRVEGVEDMEKLTLEDTLYDTVEEEQQEEMRQRTINLATFNEVKDVLIDMMGQRQFEQFFRDYAEGHTTAWSRRKMQTVKQKFEQEGLTRLAYNNKYGK